MRNSFRCIFLLIILLFIPQQIVGAEEVNLLKNNEDIARMEEWIETQLEKSKIPGISVTIVERNETVYSSGFGFSDIDTRSPVTESTLFEIGSNSKAFTGLAILQLINAGEINIDDPITKYLPSLKLRYDGVYKGEKINDYVNPTIGDFLYHTSGVPFETIKNIPELSEATEKVHTHLCRMPLRFRIVLPIAVAI